MVHIDNLREKELVIAYYFRGNKHKELNRHEVFDMWSNWFKRDFRVNNKPVFCIENNKLTYRKAVKIKSKDMAILKDYDESFKKIYKYIEKVVVIEKRDKTYLRQALERERNREYGRVINVAKPLNIRISMNTKTGMLAEFRLYCNGTHNAITSGDCDKMIRYMNENIKTTNDK